MAYIYSITHKRNGQMYIGRSVNHPNKRWSQHIHMSRKNKPPTDISYYMKEQGIDSFAFDIIEECDRDEVGERERYWIRYYNTYNNGFNSNPGG